METLSATDSPDRDERMSREPQRLGLHLIGAGIFLLSLALYISTMAPTLTSRNFGADGGDLLAAAYNLGVPHPPGYPSYVLLVKLFSILVPWGDFAFRANLLSAIMGATAVLLLYYTVLLLLRAIAPTERRHLPVIAAVISALALAASPLLWSQSTIAEVYSLNAVFASALILLAVRTALPLSTDRSGNPGPSDRPKYLSLFALLLGLGLGNHLTLILLAAPLMYWLLTVVGWRRLFSPWNIGAFVLGLSVYLYLPIRASQTPPINWGGADSLGGFIWMITADPYREYAFRLPRVELIGRLSSWPRLFFEQVNVLGVFMGLAGAYYLWKRVPRLFTATFIFLLVLSVYSISYGTEDSVVYMVSGILVFALWLGLGFYSVSTQGLMLLRDRWPAVALFRPLAVLAVASLALVPGVTLALNYGSQNLRSDFTTRDHYSQLIQDLPEGSVVLAKSEEDVFGLWYMRYVDRQRTDVMVVATPLLQYDWYWRDLNTLFPDRISTQDPGDYRGRLNWIAGYNVGRVPVYITYNDTTLGRRFTLHEEGDIYRVE